MRFLIVGLGEERAKGVRRPWPSRCPLPAQADWVKSVLFDRGYLARIRGEAIKVYLVMLEACGGLPDRSVTISLNQLMKRTRLSCPTVIDSLRGSRTSAWSSRRPTERGKVKTYYVLRPAARAGTAGERWRTPSDSPRGSIADSSRRSPRSRSGRPDAR